MKKRCLLLSLTGLILAVACSTVGGCITVVMPAPEQVDSMPVINLFEANPNDILAGKASTIRWDVSNATSVSIDPSIGVVIPSGSTSVSPSTTTTYTLTATNSIGSVTATTQLRVSGISPPSISTVLPLVNLFTATPPAISTGSSSKLSWDVSNAASVNISPDVGVVGISGNIYVSPATTTNYTLTASNATGTTVANIQVAVATASPSPTLASLPFISSFIANPASIVAGGSSTLNWSVSNANSVTIKPTIVRNLDGSVSATGSASVSPSVTTTYTLTAANNVGESSRTITVIVYSQPSVSEPLNWAGTWNTNWGTMYLSQSMGKVTGTYAHDNGKIVGYISKNLSGDQLVGTWSEAPTYAPPNDAGDIEWYASPDFNSFTGKWRYGSEGEWDGTWSGTRVTP